MCETPEIGKDEHPTPNVSSMSVFFLSMCSGVLPHLPFPSHWFWKWICRNLLNVHWEHPSPKGFPRVLRQGPLCMWTWGTQGSLYGCAGGFLVFPVFKVSMMCCPSQRFPEKRLLVAFPLCEASFLELSFHSGPPWASRSLECAVPFTESYYVDILYVP